MYNRYVPQSDGSFHRSRHPDNIAPPRQQPIPAPPPPAPEPKPEPPAPRPAPRQPRPRPVRPPEPKDTSITGFLRQLLPKNFDSGDLLVVLLLLLMSGDSSEDQNTALLTLALYLFL